MNRFAFIKRFPVLSYFLMVFILSWGIWLLLTGGTPMGDDPRFMFVAVAAPLAPAFAGLLLTGLLEGKSGYRGLLQRLVHWRIPWRWYAMALLVPPGVSILTAFLLAYLLDSSGFIPAIMTMDDPAGLLLTGSIGGFLVGLCEELGWTGFLTLRLRPRYGVLSAGLFIGLVWGAWHGPLFIRDDTIYGKLPMALWLLQLFSWLPACRVLMVWMYDRTGSLLIAVLMHISLASATIILIPSETNDLHALASILVSAVFWWSLVAVVLMSKRK